MAATYSSGSSGGCQDVQEDLDFGNLAGIDSLDAASQQQRAAPQHAAAQPHADVGGRPSRRPSALTNGVRRPVAYEKNAATPPPPLPPPPTWLRDGGSGSPTAAALQGTGARRTPLVWPEAQQNGRASAQRPAPPIQPRQAAPTAAAQLPVNSSARSSISTAGGAAPSAPSESRSALHYELLRFAVAAAPTPGEAAAVEQGVKAVAAATRRLWPQAVTTLFGSQVCQQLMALHCCCHIFPSKLLPCTMQLRPSTRLPPDIASTRISPCPHCSLAGDRAGAARRRPGHRGAGQLSGFRDPGFGVQL